MSQLLVLGAGPVGLFLAAKLKIEGYDVTVIEKSNGLKKPEVSTAITISEKGIVGLASIGVWDMLQKLSQPIVCRATHYPDGNSDRYLYSKHHCMWALDRIILVNTLFERCKALGVHFIFGANPKIKSVDEPILKTKCDQETVTWRPKFIFAADGAYSKARRKLQGKPFFDVKVKFSPQMYISVSIPVPNDVAADAVNVWVGNTYTIMGLPVKENSTSMLRANILFDRSQGFNAEEIVKDFPIFASLNLHDNVLSQSSNWEVKGWPLVDISCKPWGFGKVVLLGDAAHGMLPILGQGLNAGLGTVNKLVDWMKENVTWDCKIHYFTPLLRQETEAVRELTKITAEEVFYKIKNSEETRNKNLEIILDENTAVYQRHYEVMAFSNLPYSFALALLKANSNILNFIRANNLCASKDLTEFVKSVYQSSLYGDMSIAEYLQKNVDSKHVSKNQI